MSEQISNQPGAMARVFGCDIRSLAAFRIGLGLMVLADVVLRSFSMEAMYTDAGIFTSGVWAEYMKEVEGSKDAIGWTLHRLFGGLWWQVLLFALTAVAAVALTIGYRTRIATIICWVLVSSVQVANPIILTSGDTILKLVLFWSMFLPLGHVWSMDARRTKMGRPFGGSHWPWVASAATAGLLLQIIYVYFFTGFSKCNEFWYSGNAMEYVLRLDIYATDFGKWMLNFPGLLKVVAWATVWGEVIVPLLLLVPCQNWRIRIFSVAAFWALHIGILLCMSIGLFPYICLVAWVAFLPSQFWNYRWVQGLTGLFKLRPIRKDLTENVFGSAFWPVQTVCLFFIAYFGLWNVSNIYLFRSALPKSMYVVGQYTNTKQAFLMFDVPPQHSPWFVYDAQLADGTKVDIFRDAPVDYEHPKSVRRTVEGHHWRRLHRNLSREKYKMFREPTAEYVVRRWNATHTSFKQIEYMKLTAFLDEIGPGYNGTDRQTQVWKVYSTEDADERRVFEDAFEKAKRGDILLP